MHFFFLLILSGLILSCTHNPATMISIGLGDRQTLYFTGKGAAAGMMMDAFLGGAGVAIGIAIDEGIAKDISSALQINNPKFSMDVLVKDVLRDEAKHGLNLDGLKSIVIEKYGFQSAPDDRVVALLELQLMCESGASNNIKFVPSKSSQSITFEQAKTDGKLVENQLREAVEELLKSIDKAC